MNLFPFQTFFLLLHDNFSMIYHAFKTNNRYSKMRIRTIKCIKFHGFSFSILISLGTKRIIFPVH